MGKLGNSQPEIYLAHFLCTAHPRTPSWSLSTGETVVVIERRIRSRHPIRAGLVEGSKGL